MVVIESQTLIAILVGVLVSLLSIMIWYLYRVSVNLEGLDSVRDETKQMRGLLHEMTGRVDNISEYEPSGTNVPENDVKSTDSDSEDSGEIESESGSESQTEGEDVGESDEEKNDASGEDEKSFERPNVGKDEEPDALQGMSHRISTGYGKLYVTVNHDPETGEPMEIFANIGSSGGFTNSFTEAIAKTISIALQNGTEPEMIVDSLRGVRSPKVAWDGGEQVNSIPDAIALALERHLTMTQNESDSEEDDEGDSID